MRLRVLAISLFFLAALIVACNAQQPSYSGIAKVVLKLDQMPDMPPMPDNPAKTGGLVPTTFGFPVIVQSGETSAFNAAPQAPPVPQGTLVKATVLYSSDPAIKVNDSYTLDVDYNPNAMPSGLQSKLLDNLKSGAIVGVNDYTLNGNVIKANANSPFWEQNVFIVDLQYTKPDERTNPFRMDLNVFKPFMNSSFYVPGQYISMPAITPAWPALHAGLNSTVTSPSHGFPDFFSHHSG